MQDLPAEDAMRAAGDAPRADAEALAALARQLIRVRALDDRLVALQRDGVIASHSSCRGHEGALVGAAAALREQDWVFGAARDLGVALVRGATVVEIVHQAFGDARDRTKGRQAPDGFASRHARFASPGLPRGAHLVHAVGFAWAARSKKDDRVALALFDEGATAGGDFHNALNFAGVFKAPCVLVCRNEGEESVAVKGIAYGVPSMRVDGADVLAVHDAVRAAVARAAAGGGPTFVEVSIDREVDPVARVGEARVAEWRAEIEAELAAAEEDARREGPPAPTTLIEDVFHDVPANLAEQRAWLERSR